MSTKTLFDVRADVATSSEVSFELEALINAHRYQRWVSDLASPFLGHRILEFGAGIGNLSRWMPLRERLILTEADPFLFELLKKNVAKISGSRPELTLLPFDLLKDPIEPFYQENLDTLISSNVLEHIEDDEKALQVQCEILRRSTAKGPRRLVFFVPAHQWLYGSMDRTFGHYRRYSSSNIKNLVRKVAPEARLILRHFNMAGMLGWWFQGRILHKKSFGLSSVKAFEALCPIIRPVDDFLHAALPLPFGQSLICVLEWPSRG